MPNSDHKGPSEGYGVPRPNPLRGFTIHNYADIYSGPTGKGSAIANPDDLIVDYPNKQLWRVIDTDYTNYTYELEDFTPTNTYNAEIRIGGCAPHKSDTFRILIDKSKHPVSLRFDGRNTVTGSDITHVRVFRGERIDSDGEVVSGYYRNGTLESDLIPLVLASKDGNKTVKSPLPGVATRDIDDGEMLTAVFYSSERGVAAIAYYYAVDTSIVMPMEKPVRQVLDVKLRSPFMSKSDDRTLKLPVNIPIDDIPLQADIQYTDGVRTINVDNTRVTLHGLKNSGSHDTFYVSSNVGLTLPLTLSYRLGRNEAYVGDDVVENVINKPYFATTEQIDGSYSVKLFVAPRWLDVDRGYRLSYYLYDLERGNVFDATPYVEAGENSQVFDPKLYNYKQRMIVRVDMSKINQNYTAHIHPQSFHISLQSPGNEPGDDFYIDYMPDGETYGEGVQALFYYSDANYWMLDVSSGCKSKAEWIKKLYDKSYPLYDRRTESEPPEPTHVQVLVGEETYTIPVDAWHQPFNINFKVSEGQQILLRWVRRTPQDELHLAMSPMLAHQKKNL